MPYIIMKRSDIPAGTLQVLDLESNESQRNLIYDPPGQTKYVNPVKRATPIVANAAGTITTVGEVSGLEAWFLANVDDGGGASLTPAECVQNVDDVLALLAFGDLGTAAGDLDLATVNGALTTGALTAPQLPDMLSVLAGRDFTIPAGVQVETGGALAVLPAIGADGGPSYGAERPTFDTSSLVLSVNTGKLSGFLRNDFEYQGVGGSNGEAVAVYNDDGTLY